MTAGHERRHDRVGILAAAVGITIGLAVAPAPADAVDDPRMVLTLPPDVRAEFLGHMRNHMDALDDVIAAMARADFGEAGKVANAELALGGGRGFGRYMPVEFREMGMAMHRAAADFADVAGTIPPDASSEDWKRITSALADISAQCRACHATFRIQ